MNQNEGLELDRPRIYEIGVQISPTLGDDGAQTRFQELKDRIIELGGEIIQEGVPERIDLAYPMYQIRENKKATFTETYFAWVKFELDASLVKSLEKELATDLSIIRQLVFKTVRANTYTPRKTPRRRSSSEYRADDIVAEEDVVVPVIDPIIEEEEIDIPSILDKKLDELVVDDVE